MKTIADLQVKLFADGADLAEMVALSQRPYIRGFTTNPTLMRKAGVHDYRQFARDVLTAIPHRPISFEVFSDEFAEMAIQAQEIAAWGPCVYVKIPVTNTRGEPSYDLVHTLSHAGVKVNVTALMTLEQVGRAVDAARRRAGQRVDVRRPHRRHRARSGADHGRRARAAAAGAAGRVDLGQPARTAQCRAGGRHRLPYHHRDG
jgi:transaldolase